MAHDGLTEILNFRGLYESNLFCSCHGLDAAVDVQFTVDALGVGFYRI